MNFNHLMVLCTCPDAITAERIARTLVEEKLAACANRVPVASVFRWEGQISTESEELLLIKTTAARYQALELRLQALHPYKVPEIIALPLVAGSAAYLGWLEDACRTD